MIRHTADPFADPPNAESLVDQALVVHQRTDPSSNDKLLIFVHGLGGSRYGTTSTWGNFPRYIFEDVPELDVGLYQYRTAISRWRITQSVSLQDEARVFADIVRDQLLQYNNIVLIGHSMGGLLCKAVIHRLVESGDRNTLSRIGGLILMATPQLGSLRVPGFLSALSYDARALKPHGELVTQINRAFEDHIALDEHSDSLSKVTIPTWAVEGVSDLWVDSLSAGIGLASSRRKVVRGSHTSIVKPPSKDADAYTWVKQRLSIALHRFKYDVFVAAAMAGHEGDAEYQENRDAVLALVEVLKTKCNCPSVFYAGTDRPPGKPFDPKALALQIDLRAMRESRNFILYYPKKIVSSVLYEAGWALILGKPAIYVVHNQDDLPFLLKEASDAFKKTRVRTFEYPDTASMLKEFRGYGPQLFRFDADTDL